MARSRRGRSRRRRGVQSARVDVAQQLCEPTARGLARRAGQAGEAVGRVTSRAAGGASNVIGSLNRALRYVGWHFLMRIIAVTAGRGGSGMSMWTSRFSANTQSARAHWPCILHGAADCTMHSAYVLLRADVPLLGWQKQVVGGSAHPVGWPPSLAHAVRLAV